MMRHLFKTLIFSLSLFLAFEGTSQDMPTRLTGKVSNDLIHLYKSKTAKNQKRITTDADTYGLDFISTENHDGYVVIEALTEKKDVQRLKNELEKMGLKNASAFGGMVSGFLPVGVIPKLQNVKSLLFVRPAFEPETRVGKVTSQSFTALNVDRVRELFGATGEGIKIGILSDSYNTLPGDGAAAGEASGDLPPVQILDEFDGRGIDEGRAMAELIHDIAPNAELAFHTAFEGQAGFAQGIIDLQQVGCDIIVDDIGYLTAPYFQDGIIAQAVDEVSRRGSAYFSSAGNSANDAFQDNGIGRFRFAPIRLAGFGTFIANAYDFNGQGKFSRTITVEPGEQFITSLQWANNYFSATGDPNLSATTDLGIYYSISIPPNSRFPNGLETTVFDDDFNVFALNAEGNIVGTGDPIEFGGIVNPFDFPYTAEIFILKNSGPDPDAVKYIDREAEVTFAEELPGDGASTLYGHSNAKSGYAVGATRYDTTPRFTATDTPPRLESFSSVGGLPIYYDINGNKLAKPELRTKPDFVASQGDNTTFFGSFDYEGDGFPNFFGTSASAPNTAAVAALLLEVEKNLNPEQIGDILKNTAQDMDNPYTLGFDAGFDFATGYGFVNAFNAMKTLLDGCGDAQLADRPIPIRFEGTIYNTIKVVEVGIYRAIQFDKGSKNIHLERKMDVNIDRFDTNTSGDGWTMIARTNGPGNDGELLGLEVVDGIPYVYTKKWGKFRKLTPASIRPVQGWGDGRLLVNASKEQLSAYVPCGLGKGRRSAVANNARVGIDDAINDSDLTQLENAVSIYPNPSNGVVSLSVGIADEKVVDVNVYNALGQTVHSSQVVGSFNEQLNFADFGAGLYIVKVTSEELTVTKKLIITE